MTPPLTSAAAARPPVLGRRTGGERRHALYARALAEAEQALQVRRCKEGPYRMRLRPASLPPNPKTARLSACVAANTRPASPEHVARALAAIRATQADNQFPCHAAPFVLGISLTNWRVTISGIDKMAQQGQEPGSRLGVPCRILSTSGSGARPPVQSGRRERSGGTASEFPAAARPAAAPTQK